MLLYVYAEFKREVEYEHRANYNSMMLYYMAQPTRKNPESLQTYKPIHTYSKQQFGKEMSGEEILQSLIRNGI
ncbi:MAG: hypothetical protein FWE24_09185 [Defluviitaleaceae bacterium]|nr:hypothetical protein [Defluviitaleaceae bacterium]